MRRGRGGCSSLRDLCDLCVKALGQDGQALIYDLVPGMRRVERWGESRQFNRPGFRVFWCGFVVKLSGGSTNEAYGLQPPPALRATSAQARLWRWGRN